jgi:virulence-associated protein VagC
MSIHWYRLKYNGEREMQTVRVFKNGGSRAIRLPKSFATRSNEFVFKELGGCAILVPSKDPWRPFLESIGKIPDLKREKHVRTRKAEL